MKILLTVSFLLVTLPNPTPVVAQSDCNAAVWSSYCDTMFKLCRYNSSPGAGCVQLGGRNGGCYDCHRAGLIQGMPSDTFDPLTQFAGVFRSFTWKKNGKTYKYQRFIVTNPGVLERIGVQPRDVLRRMNYGRVTKERLHNTFKTKPTATRIEWHTPGEGIRKTATVKP